MLQTFSAAMCTKAYMLASAALRKASEHLKGCAALQVGFMSFYALPMFDEMSSMFPEMAPMTRAVKANFQAWSDMPKAHTS